MWLLVFKSIPFKQGMIFLVVETHTHTQKSETRRARRTILQKKSPPTRHIFKILNKVIVLLVYYDKVFYCLYVCLTQKMTLKKSDYL